MGADNFEFDEWRKLNRNQRIGMCVGILLILAAGWYLSLPSPASLRRITTTITVNNQTTVVTAFLVPHVVVVFTNHTQYTTTVTFVQVIHTTNTTS